MKLDDYLANTWAILADRVTMMITLFGGPADLFLCRFLRRITRQHILQWLAPLEALARRLLVLEATTLPAPNVPPFAPRPGRVASRCADQCGRIESENPAEWRVRFALWPQGHHRETRPVMTFADRGLRENAVPIARRMEALLRLLQDRAGALSRITRILAARRTSAREAFTPYRTRNRVGPVDTHLREAQALLDTALANTS
jgi:hypothetical protein